MSYLDINSVAKVEYLGLQTEFRFKMVLEGLFRSGKGYFPINHLSCQLSLLPVFQFDSVSSAPYDPLYNRLFFCHQYVKCFVSIS